MSQNVITVVIKVTFRCNMLCSYCYEGHRLEQKSIDIRTTENIISKFAHYALSSDKRIVFIWHGGEPLLMGLDFFRNIVQIQKSFDNGLLFRNLLQTNGILLSSDFIDFFIENNFKIGISLDGPPIIHDAQRLLYGNSPSFQTVFQALEKIRSEGQETGVLAIFTKNTLEHMDEFYEFFRDNRINVKINPLMITGRAKESCSQKLVINPKEYGQGLIYLFDRWLNEPEYTISMQPFEFVLRSLSENKPRICTFAGKCYDYFQIEPNGNINPCGKRTDDSYGYGNINSHNIAEILTSPNYERFKTERNRVIQYCGECRHCSICNGGCATSSYTRREVISDPDFFCVGYMAFFDHIKQVVTEQIF